MLVKEDNPSQCCNLFMNSAKVKDTNVKMIIDSASCQNIASVDMCEKLNLKLLKHLDPYCVQWLRE